MNKLPYTEMPLIQETKMTSSQTIRCPNCGNYALRQQLVHLNVTETACPVCDYLMVNCTSTGNVLESYAPGLKGFSPAGR
jgi:phage FluMu protein Com